MLTFVSTNKTLTAKKNTMKNNKNIRQVLNHVTLFTSIMVMVSCTNNEAPKDTKEVAEDYNDAKFDDQDIENDAQFLVEAAEINLEVIQLGELAQDKGKSEDVKEAGKMMVEAHTKLLNDLTALANTKQITIPTAVSDESREVFNTLNEKLGINFDIAYAELMVSGHNDAIDAFEEAATECADMDIKNWATTALPELRLHLDQSIELQKKCLAK
jgi:putative membrane protein